MKLDENWEIANCLIQEYSSFYNFSHSLLALVINFSLPIFIQNFCDDALEIL